MNLPDEIPKRLRDLAIILTEFDDGEGAWIKADAVAVVESLNGTIVSISNVVIFNEAVGGYMASGLGFTVERYHNEADPDYAERSRSIALAFIRNSGTNRDKTLFALTFPSWKSAA